MDKKKKRPNKFIRYISVGIQMGITIYSSSLLGEWLDVKYQNDNQFYKKICTLIAVFIAMLSVIIQVSKLSKGND